MILMVNAPKGDDFTFMFYFWSQLAEKKPAPTTYNIKIFRILYLSTSSKNILTF